VCIAYLGIHLLSFSNYLDQVEQQRIRFVAGVWLQENTPLTSTVATEPLGSLGYYSDRYMIDMGALINNQIASTLMPSGCTSPEELGAFLRSERPDYLADCSGICLGRPALESAGISYTVVFSQESAREGDGIVACSIYELSY
jgi:hypothetical protein